MSATEISNLITLVQIIFVFFIIGNIFATAKLEKKVSRIEKLLKEAEIDKDITKQNR